MSNILQELESSIAGLKSSVSTSNIGVVREIGDGAAKVEGLSQVMLNEMIDFGGGLFGLALNLRTLYSSSVETSWIRFFVWSITRL